MHQFEQPDSGLELGLRCRTVIDEASRVLRNAAGNYYVNDKSTGSIVAQQPFGGARASGKTKWPERSSYSCWCKEVLTFPFTPPPGTNDKPGGPHYVLRWTSPQVVKETHVPLRDWRYPYMGWEDQECSLLVQSESGVFPSSMHWIDLNVCEEEGKTLHPKTVPLNDVLDSSSYSRHT